MSSRTAERLALEIKLREGWTRTSSFSTTRPKIDTRTGRLFGVEALLRWNSPELGLVQPARFIPLMEETGIIVEAGRWAPRRAMADRARIGSPPRLHGPAHRHQRLDGWSCASRTSWMCSPAR